MNLSLHDAIGFLLVGTLPSVILALAFYGPLPLLAWVLVCAVYVVLSAPLRPVHCPDLDHLVLSHFDDLDATTRRIRAQMEADGLFRDPASRTRVDDRGSAA